MCTGLGLRSATARKGNAWAPSIWAVQVRRASPGRSVASGVDRRGRPVGVLFAGGPTFILSRTSNVVMASLYYILLLPTGAALCVLLCFGLSLSNTAKFWAHQKAFRQLMTGQAQVQSWSSLVDDSGADNGPLELSLSTGIKVVITPHIARSSGTWKP